MVNIMHIGSLGNGKYVPYLCATTEHANRMFDNMRKLRVRLKCKKGKGTKGG